MLEIYEPRHNSWLSVDGKINLSSNAGIAILTQDMVPLIS